MKKQLTAILLFIFCSFQVVAQQPTQWRGKNSEGKYPAPKMLPSWPEEGPQILWHFDDLGDGFSSPVFANSKIYSSGMVDNLGYLYIFSEDGTLEKKLKYGKEFEVNYPGARPSPTIVGNLAYLATGYGELICLNLDNGSVLWTKELEKDFGAKNLRFGFTESIVVDGDKLYFTPGGEELNVVALNRMNGTLIWKSAGEGESAAYCTPKLIQLPNRQIMVTHTASHIICIDTKDGKLLWSYPHPNQYGIHPNTPIYQDHALFCFSGYGQGCVKLSLNDEGTAVTKVWSTNRMDSQMGGAIIQDGYIYGSGHKARGWFCYNWKSGEEKWNSTELGNGTIIMAGDKLIVYTDRGELALINPSPEKLEIISKVKVEFGTAQHWAHPVVHEGILYIRHGKSLVAYKISA